MTQLDKPVSRKSYTVVRDRGRVRELVVIRIVRDADKCRAAFSQNYSSNIESGNWKGIPF